MLGNLIGALIVILIGFSLIPIVNDQAQLVVNSSNETMGSASTIAGLVPIVFGLAVVIIALVMITTALRRSGILGGEDYDDSNDEDVEEEKPKKVRKHKQTYEEYVQERLKIEEMMK